MPLPPLSTANTERWKLFYLVGGKQHSLQMRVDATGVSQTTAEAGFSQLLTDISADLWTVTFVRLEHAPVGSTIFNPVTSALTGTLAGAGAPSAQESVRQLSFVGRATTGRKSRVFIYGFKSNNNDNMRITPAENANVGTAINRINGYLHLFVGIDGIKPVYSQYVNVNFNQHWTKAIRKI